MSQALSLTTQLRPLRMDARQSAEQLERAVGGSQRPWQAAAWFLERKHPGRWARAANASVQGETTRDEAVERGADVVGDVDG